MKKIILSLVLCLLLITPLSLQAAQTARKGLQAAAPQALQNQGTLPQTVGKIISAVLAILGVLLLALLIYGGYTWMYAKGDPSQVKKAQDIIRAAIVGLIIIFMSWAISSYVISALMSNPTV